MVAEKPALAQSLAAILSNGTMKSRKGLNNACTVYEYMGKFQNEPARFKMTSVCGHVMTTDFIGKYNSWDRVDPVSDQYFRYVSLLFVPCIAYRFRRDRPRL